MRLYEALAAEYTAIFPSSQNKVDFVEKYLDSGKNQNILDIGCASGEFVYQLSSSVRKVTGIDLDPYMILEAKSGIHFDNGSGIYFYQADMIDFLSASEANCYDAVCCLGNTLVYLDGEKELKVFLSLSYKALKEQGIAILQILNYGNPLIGPGFTFPAAESKRIEFSREYRELSNTEKLGFKTAVRDKKTGETHTDIHRHYPFSGEKILEIAAKTGFTDTKLFGGYDGKEAEVSDFFHLAILEK